MSRVIIFKGASQYATLRVFSDELVNSFKNIGVEAVTVDLTDKNFINILQQEINRGCNFFVGFNGVGIDLKAGSNCLYDVLNVPFINILMDHPYHHIQRLTEKANRYVVTVVDKNHLEFFKHAFHKEQFSVVGFLPHGGIKSSGLKYSREQFENRSANILYTGTLKTDISKGWHSLENLYFKNLIEDVYNAKTDYKTIEESVLYVLNQRGTLVREAELAKIINYSLNFIDDYETRKNRWEVVEFLCVNNIPVDAYGNGPWHDLSGKYKNIHYKGNIDLNNLIELYTKYKITINDNNNFRRGSHDRVFNALANGCLCITSNSLYYKEIFSENFLNICQYKRGDMDNLKKVMYAVINNDNLYEEIAPIRDYVIEKHLWKNRAEKIMELYNMASV